MFYVIVLGFLALLLLVGFVAGLEEPRRSADPRDDIDFWVRYGPH